MGESIHFVALRFFVALAATFLTPFTDGRYLLLEVDTGNETGDTAI